MSKILKITIILSFGLFYSQNILAQELHNSFADWSVFRIRQGKKEICYIVSLPVKKTGNYNKRGEPYFLVTNIDNNSEEISISSGYNYKRNSQVELSFGLKKFNIFTYDNLAWANDRTDDIEIIKVMRVSDSVVVSGISSDNSYSKDTYSFIGFIKAYIKMKDLCHQKTNKKIK